MEPSVLQRMRGRRARAHTSQESLVKDSSSEASPRDSAIADRRRRRRAQQSPQAQEYDNQAYDGDDRPLPPTIERDNDDEDEEEENVQNADRLVSHVAKQHRRVVNEVQQQSKKPKRKGQVPTDADDDQADLNEQIREQQEILSRRVGDTDDEQVSHVDSLPPPSGTARGKSLQDILELARKSRTRPTTDDTTVDPLSTMGSSRRFGTSSELKLQKILRRNDTQFDASQIASPDPGDRSTRFDYDATRDNYIRQEIDEKQKGRTHRWKDAVKNLDNVPLPSDQEDFFLKVWPSEAPEERDKSIEAPSNARVTTADAVTGEKPQTTTEAEQVDDPISVRDKNLPEEKRPLLPIFGEGQPTQYQRADIPLDEDEQRDTEIQRYKYVVGQPATLQEKLGVGAAEPRSLEEEGIFVGKRPIVPTNSVHRTERRILQECAVDNKPPDRWFGPDGAIVSLPDPTKFVPTRPLIDDLFDPILGREFCKAYVMDNKSRVANDPIGSDRYRLDIDLGTLTFLHHHFMSIEHVFAMKLKQMYEHYTVRCQQRIVQQLSDKIKALKSAENNCRALYEQNRYSSSALPEELHNRLVNYQSELRQARNQRCNEMKLDRQLLQRLLDTWKKIKEVRRNYKYTTTSVRLLIKQKSGIKPKHYEQMQREIEEEIEDEIALADEQFRREKEVHAQIVKKRKLQAIRKKEARKRVDKKRNRDMTADGTGDGDFSQDDIAILNEEDIIVPEKPEPRKPDEIRTTILAKYQNAIRPADEPEILLELVYSEQISTDSECTARERARRHQAQTASNIIVRIVINDKIAVDTPPIPLTSDFETHISQVFPCYVVRTPDTIKIQLYESSTRLRSPLAELYLPIPEATITTENYQLQPIEFSSNVLRQFNPNQTTAIGAGIPTPIEIDDKERIYLNIEGIINAGVAWGVQDGVVLVPPDLPTSKAFQNRHMAGGLRQDVSMQAVNLSNMKDLIDWIKQSNLDPYDPENAFLINLMKDYMGTHGDARFEINALQHFRLWIDENDETEQQRKQMEMDNSLRFKLLQARKENLPDFRDYKHVPPYDYLVRKEHGVFKSFMARRHETVEADGIEQQLQEKRQTHIDAVRRQGERQLRKMREQVLARFALTSARKSYQQMVVEETVPNIQALSGFLSKLYIEPTRPLYPAKRRTEQKKVTNLAVAANRDVFILVNLIGAIDLPIRREALENERAKTSNRTRVNADRTTLVRPYVEIQFQKKTYRTSTVEGPNPSWNEELRIPFR
ncbi:unnamed protein product [Adineta ricciae]|uniref:C2 domain-containing protein n=1 Tax=Adineta ricciae TaxID=249248 RepID=A0A814P9V7_ADIRI|nr:unnamed protein product [Adineta ricciae]